MIGPNHAFGDNPGKTEKGEPVMLQGEHDPVAFRTLYLKRIQ